MDLAHILRDAAAAWGLRERPEQKLSDPDEVPQHACRHPTACMHAPEAILTMCAARLGRDAHAAMLNDSTDLRNRFVNAMLSETWEVQQQALAWSRRTC